KRNDNYLPRCNVKEFKKHPLISKRVLYYIIYSFLSSLSSFSSFILLIFSFTSPLSLSYLPSACFFLSLLSLPSASFTFLSSLSSFSSFILLIFSFTSPLTLSYLPSACFFLSPVTLPAASFTFPLTLSLMPSNFSSFLLLMNYSPLFFICYN